MTKEALRESPHTDIRVALIVYGAFVTENDIFKIIGESPSAAWRAGDNIQNTLIKRKEDGWRLDSKLPPENSLPDHLKNIIERIYLRLDQFLELKPTSVRIAVAIDIYGLDRPALQIDADIISKIAKIGAMLDIDLHVL